MKKYPDNVNIETTPMDYLGKENTKRFSLVANIDRSKSDSVVVIMKNPKCATCSEPDATVMNVIKYITNVKADIFTNVGKIEILNLMPISTKDSSSLKASDFNTDEENKKMIEETIENNKNVVIAWGTYNGKHKTQYKKLCDETLNLLKRENCNLYYIGEKNKDGTPKHGSQWKYDLPNIL